MLEAGRALLLLLFQVALSRGGGQDELLGPHFLIEVVAFSQRVWLCERNHQ